MRDAHEGLSTFIKKLNETAIQGKKSLACSMGGTKYHQYCMEKKKCVCDCHKRKQHNE